VRGVFTIGLNRRFADEIARTLLAGAGEDPLALADTLVLVPTRRATRTLADAFLRAAEGRPTILPRLAALGDIDAAELDAAEALAGGIAADLPPAISTAEREALLARLVAAFTDGATGQPVAGAPAHALKLARELARLLDDLLIEGVPFERLGKLVPDIYASHWQRVIDFLGIVGAQWPALLAERGRIDAADRRNRLIRGLAERWRAAPPSTPVIAAGSTGSQPATRELLATIAALPRGAVVLPALDRGMDDASWAALDQSHPQLGLRELLDALGTARRDVADWPGSPPAEDRRLAFLSEVMRPADTTHLWRAGDPVELQGIERVDLATPRHEALAIALALRETLEDQGRTAMLITPDRELARRVRAELARWDIEIDDSAGQPLSETPPATLLRLVARALEAGFAPIELLALLKHPLCRLGLPRADLLERTRRLDARFLRGLKPAPGLEPIRLRLMRDDDDAPAEKNAPLLDLLTRLETALTPLTTSLPDTATRTAPAHALHALIAASEACAAADPADESARESLWSGEAGEALFTALGEAVEGWSEGPPIRRGELAAWLDTLLTGAVLRPRRDAHPRLAIRGPLEARLQRADLVVLGGLNEGSWPPEGDTGPWLSRPMRAALGLAAPERRVGLAAHDFTAAFAATRVLLTRSERVDGSPTVASRWLVRLDALLGTKAAATWRGGESAHKRLDAVEALDRPTGFRPRPRPAPRPPPEARPTRLSVSRIETWRRDPYGLYARAVLDLRKLDDLEAPLTNADRGSAVHDVLDQFLTRHRTGPLPADAEQALLTLGQRTLGELLTAPAERVFWLPRFERLAAWFVREENRRRLDGRFPLDTEVPGEFKVGPLTITARADRIDRAGARGWEILDYKSGRVPSKKEVEELYSPQLLLEAAMALAGGFARAGATPEHVELAYWQVNGLGEGGKIREIENPGDLVAKMLERLGRLVEQYARPETPYIPVPLREFAPAFNDYAHLERALEWSSGDDEAAR